MKTHLFVVFLIFSGQLAAQSFTYKNKDQGGTVSIGIRSTMSTFNSDHHEEGEGNTHVEPDPFALGLGGQFRVQASNRVNTEWFFDYLPSANDKVRRNDYHIGWSVMYYLRENPAPVFRPYVLAGHCFDYTYREEIMNHNNNANRWSSAVQAGIGAHFRLNDRLDISFLTQYMLHLGTHIETIYSDTGITFGKVAGGSMEGHLLSTVSLNYKISDLW